MRRSSADAPQGFAPWLDNHLQLCDPLNRVRQMQGDRPNTPSLPPLPSVRCWDEHCIHFIYGFPSRLQRDNHAQVHNVPCNRDSALSIGSSPPPPLSEHPSFRVAEGFEPSTLAGPQPMRQAVPLNLPPLTLPAQPRECVNPPGTSASDDARHGTRRSSATSDAKPHLPPMKKARLGRPRLESIGELRLVREKGPCLRCRAARKEVAFVARHGKRLGEFGLTISTVRREPALHVLRRQPSSRPGRVLDSYRLLPGSNCILCQRLPPR